MGVIIIIIIFSAVHHPLLDEDLTNPVCLEQSASS
jgi:hypothetical protein